MGHGWAQFRRTISRARAQTESLRHIYLGLTSDMNKIPGSYGAITSVSQEATNPSILSPPENVHSNCLRALDEVLSNLRTLEIKYMLERGPSAMSIPLLLRLKFKIKGKRKLKDTLRELHIHNDNLETLIKHLRKTIPCNLALSAHRVASMNVEPHAAVSHITPPQAEQTFSVPSTEDLIYLPPTVPPNAGGIAAISDPLQIPPLQIPPLQIPPLQIPPLQIPPPQIPPPQILHPTPSSASSRVRTSVGGVFQSSTSLSYEHEDNYSLHSGDRICPQCHQMCRGDLYS